MLIVIGFLGLCMGVVFNYSLLSTFNIKYNIKKKMLMIALGAFFFAATSYLLCLNSIAVLQMMPFLNLTITYYFLGYCYFFFLILINPFQLVLSYEKLIHNFKNNTSYIHQISFGCLLTIWGFQEPQITLFYFITFFFISIALQKTFKVMVKLGWFLINTILFIEYCLVTGLFIICTLSFLSLVYLGLLFCVLCFFILFLIPFLNKKTFIKNHKLDIAIQEKHFHEEMVFFLSIKNILTHLFFVYLFLVILVNLLGTFDLGSFENCIRVLNHMITSLKYFLAFLTIIVAFIRFFIAHVCNTIPIEELFAKYGSAAGVSAAFIGALALIGPFFGVSNQSTHNTFGDETSITINPTLSISRGVVSSPVEIENYGCNFRNGTEKTQVISFSLISGSQPPLIVGADGVAYPDTHKILKITSLYTTYFLDIAKAKLEDLDSGILPKKPLIELTVAQLWLVERKEILVPVGTVLRAGCSDHWDRKIELADELLTNFDQYYFFTEGARESLLKDLAYYRRQRELELGIYARDLPYFNPKKSHSISTAMVKRAIEKGAVGDPTAQEIARVNGIIGVGSEKPKA